MAPISTTKSTPVVVAPQKEVTQMNFSHPNVPVSPRKLRLIIDVIRPLSPLVAIDRLKFTNSTAARYLHKFIKNAVATAKNNYQFTPESLAFKSIAANDGLKIKRMDKSHGSRFARGVKVKRHSRLNLILSGKIASPPNK
ncbi:MAG: uL22 family ribosomal protein [Candidatus Shapirobacteria bacterium]